MIVNRIIRNVSENEFATVELKHWLFHSLALQSEMNVFKMK